MPHEPPANESLSAAPGHYDPRKGAGGYAPIVASFGALAVTAIVIVFSAEIKGTPEQLTTVTGLLAISVLGSYFGAFGLASVAAEKHPEANMPAVILFHAVPVAISFISILGAFQVLSAVYIPTSTPLFAGISAAGGVGAVLFMSFFIRDDARIRPPKRASAKTKGWWSSNRILPASEGDTGYQVGSAAMVLVGIGLIAPYMGKSMRVPVLDLENAVALPTVGLISIICCSALGMFRSRKRAWEQEWRPLRTWESWTSTLLVSFYTYMLLVLLPR